MINFIIIILWVILKSMLTTDNWLYLSITVFYLNYWYLKLLYAVILWENPFNSYEMHSNNCFYALMCSFFVNLFVFFL